jgi:hypothetical protein
VDFDKRIVRVSGQEVHLTRIEYKLLQIMMRYPDKVLTHRQLPSLVWGPHHIDQTHYLRVYMGQLRRKLEEDSARPRHIRTESGIGLFGSIRDVSERPSINARVAFWPKPCGIGKSWLNGHGPTVPMTPRHKRFWIRWVDPEPKSSPLPHKTRTYLTAKPARGLKTFPSEVRLADSQIAAGVPSRIGLPVMVTFVPGFKSLGCMPAR